MKCWIFIEFSQEMMGSGTLLRKLMGWAKRKAIKPIPTASLYALSLGTEASQFSHDRISSSSSWNGCVISKKKLSRLCFIWKTIRLFDPFENKNLSLWALALRRLSWRVMEPLLWKMVAKIIQWVASSAGAPRHHAAPMICSAQENGCSTF